MIVKYGAKVTGKPTAEKRDDAIGLLRMAAEEIWRMHQHHYPKCEGGCPAEDILQRIGEAIGDKFPHTRDRSATQPLTQVEFEGKDFEKAYAIGRQLGYEQMAYTSTSSLIGVFCLPENPEHTKGPHRHGCIIKTLEHGLMFVQTAEDVKGV